jgi:membrane protein DedA with SNARE-associated domain
MLKEKRGLMMEQSMVQLLQEYGYMGIFFYLILGIVGLPLPDEITMTFLGYLASIGHLHLLYTYLSALAGAICGITISYGLGIRFGYPFLKKYGRKIFITPRRLRIAQMLFRKYGNGLLIIGYFIPGVRHVTAYVAGISKLPFIRFALYAYAGAIFWCAVFIGLGYVFGAKYKVVFAVIHRYGIHLLWVLLFVALLGLGWYLWRHYQSKSGYSK